MKQLLFISFIMVLVSVQGKNLNRSSPDEIKNAHERKQITVNYTYTIIPSKNNTWGYDIFKSKKILIHQINIPGMPGNEGFKKKSYAKKVAQIVIDKLKNGEMPPSITKEELENLKVL